MSHKNRKNLHGVTSDLKGRLLLVTLVLTGFIAQLAIIGPTRTPNSAGLGSQESIAEQSHTTSIAQQDHEKLKPLKVAPSHSSANRLGQPHESDSSSPPLQGIHSPAASSASGDHKKSPSKNNHNGPERTTQRCLLFNRILCN